MASLYLLSVKHAPTKAPLTGLTHDSFMTAFCNVEGNTMHANEVVNQ